MIPLFFLSVKPRKLRKLPQGFAQPSRLKSTQIYSKSISSVSPPKGHLESGSFAYSTPQDSLINPQYSLIESQSFFTRREPVHISQTDIRTLFQVRVYGVYIYKILQASGEKLKACLIKIISHQNQGKRNLVICILVFLCLLIVLIHLFIHILKNLNLFVIRLLTMILFFDDLYQRVTK